MFAEPLQERRSLRVTVARRVALRVSGHILLFLLPRDYTLTHTRSMRQIRRENESFDRVPSIDSFKRGGREGGRRRIEGMKVERTGCFAASHAKGVGKL